MYTPELWNKTQVIINELYFFLCANLARVVNCPNEVQEITFSETTKNITLSSVKHLPNIYGQSCNGTNLTIFFPEVEIKWSRKIQTFEITVNDTLGQSAPCLLRLKTTGKKCHLHIHWESFHVLHVSRKILVLLIAFIW